jgi:hypothetical protein
MRKVIQIATSTLEEHSGSPLDTRVNFSAVTALCDDGTLWQWNRHSKKWHQLADVPQPEGADHGQSFS